MFYYLATKGRESEWRMYISSSRIGKSIQRVRCKSGIHAKDVVARLESEYNFKIDVTQYSKIENCKRGVSLPLATMLVDLFDSSYEELILGKSRE